MNKWYAVNDIQSIDTPALLIYPERIRHNIGVMIDAVGDPQRLRPHVKTYKMAEVVKMQMEAGISKFKCATIAEAEMLGQCGVKDILLAYQPVGPKIERLHALSEKYPDAVFSALIDNPEIAQKLSQRFADRPLGVYVDVNTGNNRTGIRPVDVPTLISKIQELSGITLKGFHAYDGHLRDEDFDTRKSRCNEALFPVEQLCHRLDQKLEIIAGGSPTFPIHSKREDVICSPGTCLLWDWGYGSKFKELDFQHAALVATRAISKVSPTRICLDLGHKAIASENPFPRVHLLNLPEHQQVGHSEEHLVIEVENNLTIEVGDIFYGVPMHICPTVALYQEAHIIDGGTGGETWKVVARDRKITF